MNQQTTCPATRVHNTTWAYRKHGCRCPEAVKRMRARWREQDHNPNGRGRRQRRNQRARENATYVDQLAVDLACRGDRVRLTIRERWAAIDRLDTGQPARLIAERLHIATRTVERRRAARQRAATTTTARSHQ